MDWQGTDWYRAQILKVRKTWNQNNIWRTDYYKIYWETHPEVPWSLLAHLVSRNAGYQMSDLARFAGLETILLGPGGLSTATVVSALFAMLEAGNFLIFRDVLPALEVYRRAKLFPDHSTELFDLLREPVFDVDPFIVARWETFFNVAKSANWAPGWSTDWSAGTEIQKHSFAVVANEQNQIADRLINDPSIRYWRKFFPFDLRELVRITGEWGLTRLCVPQSKSLSEPTADRILVYTVLDFTSLDKRIHAGRDLFAGLFQDTNRSRLVQAWVSQRKHYTGSRTDYNSTDYSTSKLAILPTVAKYSPPLKPIVATGLFDKFTPAWPFNPGTSPRYGYIHRDPILLPRRLSDVAPTAKLNEWMAPLSTPTRPFAVCFPSDLCEIVY